jgi:hypothetical protein
MEQCTKCAVVLPEGNAKVKLFPRTPREVTLCYDCYIKYAVDRANAKEKHHAFPDYPARDVA